MLSDTAPPTEKCGSGFAVCEIAELTAASRVDDATLLTVTLSVPGEFRTPFPAIRSPSPAVKLRGMRASAVY